jgi:hypothetical protein
MTLKYYIYNVITISRNSGSKFRKSDIFVSLITLFLEMLQQVINSLIINYYFINDPLCTKR